MQKKKDILVVRSINGEFMLFRSGKSLCDYMEWNPSVFYRNIIKGYYQRDGYSVIKKPLM